MCSNGVVATNAGFQGDCRFVWGMGEGIVTGEKVWTEKEVGAKQIRTNRNQAAEVFVAWHIWSIQEGEGWIGKERDGYTWEGGGKERRSWWQKEKKPQGAPFHDVVPIGGGGAKWPRGKKND